MSASAGDVTLSNWQTSPYNQWAYKNVERLMKTQNISRPTAASHLATSSYGMPDDFVISFQKQKITWKDYLTESATDAIVVLHRGEIVCERYFNDNEVNSKHILMSISKSIVGLVTGILYAQGKLSPDDRVTKYVPEVAESASYGSCTLRNLLDMRSGVSASDQNPDYRAAIGWAVPRDGEESPNMFEYIAGLKSVEDDEPGGIFVYNSINTELLGWCLERATGRKLADLITDLLWKPMGAEFDANITVDKSGNARGAGGVSASARDVARIGRLLARKGAGIIPSTWVEDMIENGDTKAWAESVWGDFPDSEGDAYHSCWISNARRRELTALGVYGQMLVVDVENDVVMAKTSSQPAAAGPGQIVLGRRAFREIVGMLQK